MIYLELTDAQRQELHTLCRQAVGRIALRALMALLSGHVCPVFPDRAHPWLRGRCRSHLAASLPAARHRMAL